MFQYQSDAFIQSGFNAVSNKEAVASDSPRPDTDKNKHQTTDVALAGIHPGSPPPSA